MAEQGIELATAYVNLVSSARGLGDSITGELADAGKQAESEGKKAGGKFSGAFGKGMAVAGGLAVAGGAITKVLYDIGGTFDDVTDTIRVGTGATGDNLDSLIESAKAVGAAVPTEFDKAGSVVADLNTRLGLSGKTLETVAAQYIQAGNILGEDIDIQSTTAAFSAFSVEGDAVSGAMDALFQVSQATGVGMNELAKTASNAGPAMKNLGFGFEDTTALIGSLDKAGLNSTAVMASMSKGLVTLAKDGQSPKEAFRDVTSEIESLVASGKQGEAIDLASGVFGTKAAVQFVGAVESGTLAFGDLMGATGATGDTILGLGEETADLAESFTLLKNRGLLALEPVATRVFNTLSAGMAFLADNITPAIGAVTDTISGMYSILAKGDFTGAFAGFEEDSKLVDVLFTMREKAEAFGQSFGPAISSGMAKARPVLQKGADAAMSGVRSALDTARPYAEKAFASLGPAMSKARPALQKAGTAAMGYIGKTFDTLKPILADTFATLGPVIKEVFAAIGPLIQQLAPIFAQLYPLMNPFMLIFKQLLPILPQLAQLVGQIATAIGGALVAAMDAILPILPDIALLIGQVAIVLADGLAQAVLAIVPLVTTLAGALVELLPSFVELISSLLPPLLQLFEAVIPLIAGVIGVVVPLVAQFVDFLIPAINALLPVVKTVFGIISSTIKTVMGVIQGIITTVTGLISGNWTKVWEGIKKVVTSIIDGH